eukprot:CAMPEP_0202096006 /NCGR_PEP_ID=MMETSP0965-20130614/368_1 /ASSEMBLY_ACC=CAM_ASM_000507 /TAXON_ID=4773 /ORGANISM="Schizochytrium aggregatum, Strain ATCC28209" /LENGTH=62 /DNA_ID=CAMNT_0048664315 /DNA_START=14 /DNA_END=199 /DNA_ORIENTATION=+
MKHLKLLACLRVPDPQRLGLNSFEPETMRWPSDENATLMTSWELPLISWSCSPVSADQTRTV